MRPMKTVLVRTWNLSSQTCFGQFGLCLPTKTTYKKASERPPMSQACPHAPQTPKKVVSIQGRDSARKRAAHAVEQTKYTSGMTGSTTTVKCPFFRNLRNNCRAARL